MSQVILTTSAELKDRLTGFDVICSGTLVLDLDILVGIVDLVLDAPTVDLDLTFPTSLITAKVLIVKPIGNLADLTVKISGSSDPLEVPKGATLMAYNATSVSVSSTTGGTIQFAIGG
jgi:hypothetical protein